MVDVYLIMDTIGRVRHHEYCMKYIIWNQFYLPAKSSTKYLTFLELFMITIS